MSGAMKSIAGASFRQRPTVLLDGAAARVLDTRQREAPFRQLARRIAQPDVHVHGDREFVLSRLGNLVDVSRLVIQLEDLVGVVAERLLPRAAWFLRGRKEIGRAPPARTARLASGEKSRTLPMFPASFSTCTIRTVWSASSIALRWRISAREGRLVRLERRLRDRREDVYWLAIGPDDPRETLRVGLHPLRDVVHVAVLPRPEPQEHDVKTMLAGSGDDRVDVRPVEGARPWLRPVPSTQALRPCSREAPPATPTPAAAPTASRSSCGAGRRASERAFRRPGAPSARLSRRLSAARRRARALPSRGECTRRWRSGAVMAWRSGPVLSARLKPRPTVSPYFADGLSSAARSPIAYCTPARMCASIGVSL